MKEFELGDCGSWLGPTGRRLWKKNDQSISTKFEKNFL